MLSKGSKIIFSLQESSRSMDPSQHHQAGAQLDPGPTAHLGPALPCILVPGWRGGRPGAHRGKHLEGGHLPPGTPADAQLQEERRGDFRNPLHLLACSNSLWSGHIQVEKSIVVVERAWLPFSLKVSCG